jgi:hypothetical protein
MPKTYNNLFCDVIDWENLYQAFLAARKGKRYAWPTLSFAANLEENLVNIQNHLIWESWRPGRWHEFVVHEPKRRLIQAPPFADRVVHHALVNVIGPLFENKFVFDSYACRQGRGFHMASDRVQHFLRTQTRQHGRVYVIKADIAKYFQSVRHDALMTLISRTICDPQVLHLCRRIIYQSGMDGHGIPVGALTSQLFANIYLDQLDHYIKDGLGIRCYCRYMDDFIIISPDKARLREILSKIEFFFEPPADVAAEPQNSHFPQRTGCRFLRVPRVGHPPAAQKAHRSTGQAANNFSGPALFPGPAADRGVAPADTKFFRLHETLQRASNSN